MTRARVVSLGLTVALAVGCGEDGPRSPESLPVPSAPVAVQVEGEHVTATAIALIASELEVDPRAAVDLAVFDAALATAARRELDPREVHTLSSSVLARALAVEDWRELKARPILAEELEEATQAFWLDYARPEGRRTAHAVALVQPTDPPDVHARAENTAKRVLEAVRAPTAEATREKPTAVDPETAFAQGAFAKDPIYLAFSAAARAAVPEEVLPSVVIQELPSVARDGRQIVKGMAHDAPGFDAEFTRASWELTERGQLSGVVKSQFGYHVIVLLETTPANMATEAERRVALRDAIVEVRGKRQRRALLAKLEKATKIELAPNHEALLGQVRVQLDALARDDGKGAP